jgi:hypothetical protein
MTNSKKLNTTKQKERRKSFIDTLKSSGNKFTIAANDAFVRSIQSIGYKSTGSSGAEIVDNAIEANASKISIEIGIGKSVNDIESLIFADNGYGMDPTLIRYAMTFGGTDREGSDDLFGRYGFGMPAGCMSQGNKMTVISKEVDKPIYSNTFDLNACTRGEYTDKDGNMTMPEPKVLTELPKHLLKIANDDFGGFTSGTFVIMEDLNKHSLTNRNQTALKEHLMRHLGVTFYKYLDSIEITVCEQKLKPIDPTFTTVSGRGYDVGGLKAETFDQQIFEMTDEVTGKKGKVTVTFSYLGPRFVQDPLRGKIAREWNGFIISRSGRVIDCFNRIPAAIWTNAPKLAMKRMLNNDSWWKVVLDFDPALDNLFSITTTKQQAMPKGEVWDVLENSKLFFPMLTKLRNKGLAEAAKLSAEMDIEDSDTSRPSEEAAEEASAFVNLLPIEEDFIAEIGDQKLTETVTQELMDKNKPVTEEAIEEGKKLISGSLANKMFKHGTRDVPGGNFIFIDVLGNQLRVDINSAHIFYKDFYMNSESGPVMRQYIEAFLMTLASRYHLNEKNTEFYEREITAWSSMLNDTFRSIKTFLKKVS